MNKFITHGHGTICESITRKSPSNNVYPTDYGMSIEVCPVLLSFPVASLKIGVAHPSLPPPSYPLPATTIMGYGQDTLKILPIGNC